MAWQQSEYKPEYCATAVKVLSGGESLAAVCAEIGISRKTLYNWRDAHEEFAEALQYGLQVAQRDWESLGRSGIQGDIKNFSASPWIFTMKNRFRDDYKDDKDDSKSPSESVLEQILSGKLQVKND
jgi:hypothetical protein